MFSKMRRWLAEVDAKLGENAALSCSERAARRRVGCAFLNGNLCSISSPSGCSCVEPLFLDKKDLVLVEELSAIARSLLTGRQKSLLVSAVQELRWDSMTLTRLCEILSRQLKMSYSTVKWNMRQLRSMKLLLGGTEKSKGIAARPTKLGLLIAAMLNQVEDAWKAVDGENRAVVQKANSR